MFLDFLEKPLQKEEKLKVAEISEFESKLGRLRPGFCPPTVPVHKNNSSVDNCQVFTTYFSRNSTRCWSPRFAMEAIEATEATQNCFGLENRLLKQSVFAEQVAHNKSLSSSSGVCEACPKVWEIQCVR